MYRIILWNTFVVYNTHIKLQPAKMTSAISFYVNEIHFLKFTVLFICKCTRADFMGFFIFLPNWMILACKHGMVPQFFKSIKTLFHGIMLGEIFLLKHSVHNLADMLSYFVPSLIILWLLPKEGWLFNLP